MQLPRAFYHPLKPEHISTTGFLSLKQTAVRHTGRAAEMFHEKKKVLKIFTLPTQKPREMQDGFGKGAGITWECGSSLPRASAGS